MISDVYSKLSTFVEERDWQQFHTPENLAKSISIEAAELLECFQWSNKSDAIKIEHELADVLTYCYLLAKALGKTPEDLILEKLEISISKYPANKSRGRSHKYDQL